MSAAKSDTLWLNDEQSEGLSVFVTTEQTRIAAITSEDVDGARVGHITGEVTFPTKRLNDLIKLLRRLGRAA